MIDGGEFNQPLLIPIEQFFRQWAVQTGLYFPELSIANTARQASQLLAEVNRNAEGLAPELSKPIS
jgi:hypothetical protein